MGMYDYDRRSKRAWADPRVQINRGPADRFLADAAKVAAEVSADLKTQFVGLNDTGRRLKHERDERTLDYWSERIVEGAQILLANSKKAHDLWATLVKADVQLKGG